MVLVFREKYFFFNGDMSTCISNEIEDYWDRESLSLNQKVKYFKFKEVELFQIIFE